MAIYDTFIFFNELDLLEIRMRELDAVVDHFVIVEATENFAGGKKPLYFADHRQSYRDFEKKIIHIVIDDLPETQDAWTRERFQRNAIVRGLGSAKTDDIVMISDADEIPRCTAVRQMAASGEPAMFHQQFYYYWLNHRMCVDDRHFTRSLTMSAAFSSNLETIRHTRFARVIENGGWQFSYLGGTEKIRQKIKAFSHQEYNSDEFLNESNLARAIEEGVDLFGRGFKFEKVSIDSSFPRAIVEELERYRHLVLP
jgi:hypothetical protein